MKIAKKFMTLALAAALGVGCATVGVGAAPGNTSDMAAVAPSKTSETTVDSEHSLFAGTVIMSGEGKMIVTFVNEFNVLKPEEAKPNDDGTYEVKLNVPSLTDTMEGIQLWVYSKDGTKKFVVIDPVNIDKEGKTLTVNLNDGDYFMVIADAK